MADTLLFQRFEQPQNLAQLFFDRVAKLGNRPALRTKAFGLYQQSSWRDYGTSVLDRAKGLVAVGIQPGDRVGILAENRLEWFHADLAILSAGAIDVPMHAPLTPEQVEYQLRDSGAIWLVVSGNEQLRKVAEIHQRLPELKGVITFDAPPLDSSSELSLRRLSWDRLRQIGKAATGSEIAKRVRQTSAEDLATIIYTSGTTGEPKGVMLTHGNLLCNAEATHSVNPPGHDGILLSWLPYSHIYARLCDLYLSILAECEVAFAEDLDSIPRNLIEIQPTHMTGVPRLYEKIWDSMSLLDPPERIDRIRGLFGPRLRWLSAGGAALPVHVAEGFQEAGIALLEGYGLTETSPVICTNTASQNRIGTVGQPIPGIEVEVNEEGEIITRGPHVMKGYWNKPEATAEVLTEAGWFHTGDLGELDDDGYLRITGRKKDLIVLSTGKNIAPQQLETLLVADPLIEQAVIYGDGKKFLSAIIVPCLDALRAVAADNSEASNESLVQHADTVQLYENRIDKCLAKVSSPEKVKQFILLDRPFSLDADELTATMKVRRQRVIEKHSDSLERFYRE